MKQGISIERTYDLHDRLVVRILKRRGRLTLEEVSDLLRLEGGLDWNVSIYQKIPRTGYICPHCESRLRAGETLPNIQASQKALPQRTKGATP